MKKILAIMPVSIGGRLTTSSFIDGFIQNGYEVIVFDELKNDKIQNLKNFEFEYIIGYDFSPVKIKIDNNIKTPLIAYFSDDIRKKTSGVGYDKYIKFIKNKDIFVFYWDRELAKKESLFYQPHFVNCEIYHDFKTPLNDVLFMGRLDTDLRLKTYLELNKLLPDISFRWYAIKRHFEDALKRCNENDKKIIQNTYCGFIDNEIDMAKIINESKIVYNINAQGLSSLNYRTIQTLACKRLIISDKRKELDLFNNIIPTYDNINDLASKIKFYLNNKEEYNKIIDKSYGFILKNHNSKICVKNMLDRIRF